MRQDGKKEEELFIEIRTGLMKAKAEEEARKNEEEQKEARRLRRKRNIAEHEEMEKKRTTEEEEKRTKGHENLCLKEKMITEEQEKDWARWKVELKMETLEAYKKGLFRIEKSVRRTIRDTKRDREKQAGGHERRNRVC